MRLILKFKPLMEFDYYAISKYDIQGFIYSLLKDTSLDYWHQNHGFKFFNYSNIFPITDFKSNETKMLIISSPSKVLIKTLANQLKNQNTIRLNNYTLKLIQVKSINMNVKSNIITGTPIVLFENNQSNKYFSFKNNDLDFFFKRLKDNAIKKYNSYYHEDIQLDENIVDTFKFKKEVSIRMKINYKSFIVIGSLWEFKKDILKSNKKFYNFLFDCGYGEKNSLGMGFINNQR
ncbi:CRISPR-associated endoribonuclease Cas6 [Methanosphaera sp. Vir-13MRS]|uniref:CRISPR-associated endoribonuclease Cas6 n=1 Tax=Candidatus Methanosphaera massiliense TaxID=3017187 RepID=UPI0023805689|nr:CRISPR-associated endoribonuclease Cas6 [Candidatus Methanosphaera massiliense]MDE4078680.1 CRISPR-associated endoribonuclease Cas6 [Candidatus Methanosphaera massiliense]